MPSFITNPRPLPDYRRYKNGSFLDLRSDFSADGNWDGKTYTSGVVTTDLKAMQKAVASLGKAGGGKLHVPKGHYFLGDQWDEQYMPGGPHATDAFRNQIVIDGGTGTPAEMEIDFNGSIFTTTASVVGGVTSAGAGARVIQISGNHRNLKLKNLTIVQAKWTSTGTLPAYNSITSGLGVDSPYYLGTCNISGTAVTRLTGLPAFTSDMTGQQIVIGQQAVTNWTVAITGATATFATGNTGRNFAPSDVNQYVTVYAQPYKIAAYINPTTVTLNAAPSFPYSGFSLATATMTAYTVYRVDHYVDADHLVLTQPAGTFTGATTTTWTYCPLNNRGMVLANISIWDCSNSFAIGGAKDWTYDRPSVYGSYGRSGIYASDPDTPNVGIWTGVDPLINPAIGGKILNCYFDGCVYGTLPGCPASLNRGMDGMIYLNSNQTDCLGGIIKNNGVEGVFCLGDRYSEFGMPGYNASSTTIRDIIVDATPTGNSNAHSSYGFRVDSSNTEMINITAIGNSTGILCAPGIDLPEFRQNENSSINGAKVQMPSAIQRGGNMTDAHVCGCFLIGVTNFQASNMQIRQVGDYSQFRSANGVYIGQFSSEVEVSNTRVTVPQKFAVGAAKFSGLFIYGTYGSIYYTDLKVNGADIGATIGNPGNLPDAPHCVHKRVEYVNCTKAISGNVTTCEFDRQEVVIKAGSPLGWKMLARKYNGITGRITTVNKSTSLPHQRAVFEFTGTPFTDSENIASFSQLRNSGSQAIDKVRIQLDRGLPGNVSLLLHFVDTSADISIIAEDMAIDQYCLIDPSFSDTTITAALDSANFSTTVTSLDGLQLGAIYVIDGGLATEEVVRIDNMFPNGIIQMTRNFVGTGAFSHAIGAAFGIDPSPLVYADLDMRSGLNTNLLSLQGVLTQKLRGINGCTELVNTYGYGGTFRVNTEGGSEAYLEFIRETKTVTGGSLVNADVSLWKGFRLRFLNTGGGGGMHMEYLTPSGTLGVPGTWTTIYTFESNGILGLNQINLNTSGLTALFTALTGQTNMAALANYILANGDYTGNAALVAAIAAKTGHGAPLTGTANLTTGVVTGTVT